MLLPVCLYMTFHYCVHYCTQFMYIIFSLIENYVGGRMTMKQVERAYSILISHLFLYIHKQ